MKLSSKLIVALLGAILALGACGGEFNPMLDTSGSGMDTIGMTDTDGTTGEDGSTGGMDGTGSTGEDGSSTGDDGTTGMDMGGSGETGEPMENPAPGEPCNPLLAQDGTAPCEDPNQDPNDVWTAYTCQSVAKMGGGVEFKCLEFDGKYFGNSWEDPMPATSHSSRGDMCAGGGFEGLCMDSFCVNVGAMGDENHPSGYCDKLQTEYPADTEDPVLPTACCVPWCDDFHSCPGGFTCLPMPEVGFGDNFGQCAFFG